MINLAVGGTPVLEACSALLGGATSDHLPQFCRVSLRSADGSETKPLCVATWNLMERCYDDSRYGKDTANNPFKMAESESEYALRKALQLKEIFRMLPKNDVVLLQEISGLWSDFRAPLSPFWQTLKYQGFHGFLFSAKDQQPLITLYRPERLKPKGREGGIFQSAVNGSVKYRGYVCDFCDQISGQEVTIANMHLCYGIDYTAEIAAFQAMQIAAGKMCILGGDVNHAQGIDCVGLIGDVELPTNVTYSKNLAAEEPLTLTDEDDRKPGTLKHYDGFFVSPTADTLAVITETAQSQFFARQPDGNFLVMERGDDKIYQTLTGQAWIQAKEVAPVVSYGCR